MSIRIKGTNVYACLAGGLVFLYTILFLGCSQEEPKIKPLNTPYRLVEHFNEATIHSEPIKIAGEGDNGNSDIIHFDAQTILDWQSTNLSFVKEHEQFVQFHCNSNEAELTSPPIGSKSLIFSTIKEIVIGIEFRNTGARKTPNTRRSIQLMLSNKSDFGEMHPTLESLLTYQILVDSENFAEYRFPAEDMFGTGKEYERLRLKRLKIILNGMSNAQANIHYIKIYSKGYWYRKAQQGVTYVNLDGLSQQAIFAVSPAEIKYKLRLPDNPVIQMDLGNLDARHHVSYETEITTSEKPSQKTIFQHVVTDFGWAPPQKLDLSNYSGQEITLTLKANSLNQEIALWGNPMLYDKTEARKENVIYYLIDTLRADHLGCYGYKRKTSEHLDALAERGILFSHAFSQAPWTKPSVPSYFSALHVPTHQVGVRSYADKLPDSVDTMAKLLKDEGFVTASFVANRFSGSYSNLHKGFDFAYIPKEQTRLVDTEALSNSSEEINRIFFAWLEANKDKRIFVYMHSMDPHRPYTPPPPFDKIFEDEDWIKGSDLQWNEISEEVEKFISTWRVSGKPFNEFRSAYPKEGLARISECIRTEKALYDSSIAHNDFQIGRMLDVLHKQQIDNKTIVVVSSDHGEEFFEQGFWDHGQSLYNYLIHVPLIISCPSIFPANKVIDKPVQTADILPTLLDVLGMESGIHSQGNSLMPLVRGQASANKAVFSSRIEFRSSEDLLQTTINNIYGKENYAMILWPYKSIYNRDFDSLELYNIEEDFSEQVNLATANPEIATKHKKKILNWLKTQAEAATHIERGTLNRQTPDKNFGLQKSIRELGYVQ